jgi:hypothetical protein
MSDLQHDLASLVARFRRLTVPNGSAWDVPGIRAAIDKCDAPPCEVAAAAFALAARADMKTPTLLPERGSWWNKAPEMTGPRIRHTQKCPEHPEHDMPHDHGGDMTPEQIAEAKRVALAAAAANPYIPPAIKRARALEETP